MTFAYPERAMLRGAGLAISAAVVFGGCSATVSSTPTGSPADGPAHAEATQGQFRLVFDMATSQWTADAPLAGEAQLESLGQGSATIGHAEPAIGFDVASASGSKQVSALFALSCSDTILTPSAPLTTGLVKSGAYDSPFAAQFLSGSDFRLPAGDWDITARTSASSTSCAQSGIGTQLTLTSTIRVHVVP